MRADPWEQPCSPSLAYDTVLRAETVPSGGPERIYDNDAADPSWRPRFAGFVRPWSTPEVEPLVWEGDDS